MTKLLWHLFLYLNVLCMLWIDVIKRGFNGPTVGLAAAMLGLHLAYTFIEGNS